MRGRRVSRETRPKKSAEREGDRIVKRDLFALCVHPHVRLEVHDLRHAPVVSRGEDAAAPIRRREALVVAFRIKKTRAAGREGTERFAFETWLLSAQPNHNLEHVRDERVRFFPHTENGKPRTTHVDRCVAFTISNPVECSRSSPLWATACKTEHQT